MWNQCGHPDGRYPLRFPISRRYLRWCNEAFAGCRHLQPTIDKRDIAARRTSPDEACSWFAIMPRSTANEPSSVLSTSNFVPGPRHRPQNIAFAALCLTLRYFRCTLMYFACTLKSFIRARQTRFLGTARVPEHAYKCIEQTTNLNGNPQNRPKQPEFLPPLLFIYM